MCPGGRPTGTSICMRSTSRTRASPRKGVPGTPRRSTVHYATLVQYLAAKYGIPLDREHILGHEDVPGPTSYDTSIQHWDPGPFWNWNHFMALVPGVSDAAEQARGGSVSLGTHQLVTIDPTFANNKPTVTDCSGRRCVTLPKQPANLVYLHTGPHTSYPLLSDPILHPAGGRHHGRQRLGRQSHASGRHSSSRGGAATGRRSGSPARKPGSTTCPDRSRRRGIPAARR